MRSPSGPEPDHRAPAPSSGRSSRRRAVWRRAYDALRVVVALAILAVIARQVVRDWPAVAALVSAPSLPLLLASALVALVSFVAAPSAWLVLLKGSGLLRRGSARWWLRTWLLTFFYRYVPGRLLTVAERLRLGARAGVPPVEGGALVAVETLLSACGAVAAASVVLPARLGGTAAWIAGAALIAVVLVLPLVLTHAGRVPLVTRLLRGRSLPAVRTPVLLAGLALFASAWLLGGLSFFLLASALVPLPANAALFVASSFALSTLAGVVAFFTPGGLGVREAGVTLAMATLVPAGVAAALAVAGRIWATVLELAVIGLAQVLFPTDPPE